MKNKERKKRSTEQVFNNQAEPFLYLIPHAIGLFVFVVYPIINAFVMAFKEGYRITGAYKGIGTGNFAYILKDPLFISAIKNTTIFSLTVVPIATVLSIIIAVLLNQKIRGMAFYQTAFFLPMVTSSIAIGACWKYMFNAQHGVINYFLNLFGIESKNWLGATNGSTALNLVAVIIFGIWTMIPDTTILMLSGLQNIDPLYYTAARVDGASSLKQFFRITLSLLAPTTFLTLVINIIKAFKVYKEIIPFWNGEAGYTTSNLYTIVFYIKAQFYTFNKYGYAAAASVVLFLIVLVLTKIQSYIEKKLTY